MSEVPTYEPPEGVHGPTLGIALPDGCERLRATWDPHTASADHWLASGAAVDEYLYWWRFPPLKVGDRVQLTGTVEWVDECTLSPDRVGSPAGNDHPVTIPPADDLASLAETWRVRSDRLIRWAGDPAPQDADKVQFWLGAAAAYREAIADIDDGRPASELFTPPPVPPWPGAVLSGCVDEDGAPTWLALAPNVQGEAVRTCVDFPWFICGSDNAVTPYWVEVRAPRAAPATERVSVLDAITLRRQVTHPIAPFEAEAVMWVEGELAVCEYGGPAQPVADDGTVEVLRDGAR